MATPHIPDNTNQESCLVDTSVYTITSLFRACYKFTDRAYIFLSRSVADPHLIAVSIEPKEGNDDQNLIIKEIGNELIDQGIREALEEELGPIRNLIVAQAFSEGNLLEETSITPIEDDDH